jgi:hypothetical protein
MLSARGQQIDSIQSRLDSLLSKPTSRVDSVAKKIHGKIDSAQLRLQQLLQPNLQQSAQAATQRWRSKRDSVIQKEKLDSLATRWQQKKDSLAALRLPTEVYTRKVDSLEQVFQSNYQKVVSLQTRVTQPLADLQKQLPPGAVPNTGPLTPLSGVDAPRPNALRTSPEIPGSNIQLPNDLNEKARNVTKYPQQQLEKVQSSEPVRNLQSKATDANQFTDRAQAYTQDAQQLAQGNVGELKEAPKAIEAQALKVEGVADLQEQTGALAEYQKAATEGNPEAIKAMGQEKLMEAATDHFAGQQEVLQNAMAYVTKVKGRHASVKSLAELKSKKIFLANTLKGRSFQERFRPGLLLQVMNSKDTLHLHTFPTVSYKVSGAITVGVGGYYRVVELKKEWRLYQRDAWWGAIGFATVRVVRSFHLRGEIDAISVSNLGTTDQDDRHWRLRYLAGVQKDFRITRKFTGQVLFLHSFENKLASTVPEKLHLRVGLTYTLKGSIP